MSPCHGGSSFSRLRSHALNLLDCGCFRRNETVAVGSPLYEVDTEAIATIDAESAAEPAISREAPPTAETGRSDTFQSANSSALSAPRTPTIKFLGKEGWAHKLRSMPNLPAKSLTIPPLYGRPAFTEDEMEALILGGASLEVPGYTSMSK